MTRRIQRRSVSRTLKYVGNVFETHFDLSPAGNGTKVVLTQTNLNDKEPITDANRAEYDKNWTMVLDGLKKASEGQR